MWGVPVFAFTKHISINWIPWEFIRVSNLFCYRNDFSHFVKMENGNWLWKIPISHQNPPSSSPWLEYARCSPTGPCSGSPALWSPPAHPWSSRILHSHLALWCSWDPCSEHPDSCPETRRPHWSPCTRWSRRSGSAATNSAPWRWFPAENQCRRTSPMTSKSHTGHRVSEIVYKKIYKYL